MRNSNKEFERGVIYLRNVNEFSTYDSGDEFTRLIFVSTGSEPFTYHDYEDGQDYDTIRCNMIDVLTGERMEWGPHMFSDMDTFMQFIKSIRFVIERNPIVLEKIEHDSTHMSLHDISFSSGMHIVNAIIENAKLILDGIELGRISLPREIENIFKLDEDERDDPNDGTSTRREKLMKTLKEISEIEPFPISSLCEIEKAKREALKKEIEEEKRRRAEQEEGIDPTDSLAMDDECERISDAIEAMEGQ